MRKTKYIILIITCVVFAGFASYELIHVRHSGKAMSGNAIKYHCPMHPAYVSDNPGNCLICGMKLVPLISESHENHKDHASMEKDFRKRFFITLPFVITAMLLSPNIQIWLHLSLTFPGREFLLFIIGEIPFPIIVQKRAHIIIS